MKKLKVIHAFFYFFLFIFQKENPIFVLFCVTRYRRNKSGSNVDNLLNKTFN